MNIEDIDLKALIEQETGQVFNKENKIRSPFNAADKNPSFSIKFNSNTAKWVFKDFSTGLYGDACDFIKQYKNMDYRQARNYLGLAEEKTEQEIQADKVINYINWQIKNQDSKKGYSLIGLFPFTDMNNNVIYYKAKFKKPDGKKETPYYHIENDKVINKRGTDEVPYNLYKTIQAINNNEVIIITEGEKNANTLNMILRKGYCATSVKGIKNLSELDYFKGSRIYVCSDTGEPGEVYKQNIYKSFFKESKEFKFIRLPGLEKLGFNKDIDDWITELKHNKADLLEAFKRSLDLKNIFELQQDKYGIYKLVKETNGEEEIYKRKYISNFRVVGATSLNYIDEELNNIEITFKDEYNREIKRNGNVTVLEDIRSFKCFLNSMNLTFEGRAEDLIKLKKWINTYFINDNCYVYNGNQFKKINNELVFISPTGAIGKDKVYSDIISSEKTDNNILDIESIGREELQELMKYLFKFTNYNNSYSIIGNTINDLAINQAIELKIKFSHLFIVGESGSGKSTILEQIVAALLNYPIGDKKAIGSSSKFSISKDLSMGNYPILYDEYKPSMMDKKKIEDISEKLRNAYDRNTDTRGTKNQKVNKYRALRPIILAGEESYNGEEKALIERSCIVYISKEERTTENTNAMKWLIKNNSLLNKLGKSLINKVLTISSEDYKTIRETISDNAIKYSFLQDRVLNTYTGICTGIEILNMVLRDFKLETIFDYNQYVADILKTEILSDGEEQHSMVEKMLIMLNDAIEGNYICGVDEFILCKNNELYIKTKEITIQLQIYLKRVNDTNTRLLSNSDFNKQAQKSKYIIQKQKQIKVNGKNKRFDLYDIDKFRSLGLYSILGEEELVPEPIGNNVIGMFK